MKESKDSFKYTYSSREHGEIESIVKKYLPPEENGIQRLRSLDRKVTKKASAAGITAGVIGLLLLGLGMSCVMVWQDTLFAAGDRNPWDRAFLSGSPDLQRRTAAGKRKSRAGDPATGRRNQK